MIGRAKFFAGIRSGPFPSSMAQNQVDGCNRILDEWERRGLTDLRMLAYILATAKHETAHTMQPVRETLASTDAQAISRLDAAYAKGQLTWVKTVYWRDGWFGRGLVQLTHKTNYATMGRLLGVDLVSNPSMALDPDISVKIIFEGMLRAESGIGDFTHHSLDMYFTPTKTDWTGARRIVNGTESAAAIAAIAKQFYADLQAAWEPGATKPAAIVKPAAPTKPAVTGKAAAKKATEVATVGTGALLLAWLIENPLLAGVAILVIGVLGWLAWRWWSARRAAKDAERDARMATMAADLDDATPPTWLDRAAEQVGAEPERAHDIGTAAVAALFEAQPIANAPDAMAPFIAAVEPEPPKPAKPRSTVRKARKPATAKRRAKTKPATRKATS